MIKMNKKTILTTRLEYFITFLQLNISGIIGIMKPFRNLCQPAKKKFIYMQDFI